MGYNRDLSANFATPHVRTQSRVTTMFLKSLNVSSRLRGEKCRNGNSRLWVQRSVNKICKQQSRRYNFREHQSFCESVKSNMTGQSCELPYLRLQNGNGWRNAEIYRNLWQDQQSFVASGIDFPRSGLSTPQSWMWQVGKWNSSFWRLQTGLFRVCLEAFRLLF